MSPETVPMSAAAMSAASSSMPAATRDWRAWSVLSFRRTSYMAKFPAPGSMAVATVAATPGVA